jgi:hypothetical protein
MKADEIYFNHERNCWMVHHSGSFTWHACTADEARAYAEEGYRVGE